MVIACRQTLMHHFPTPPKLTMYTTVAICIQMIYTEIMNGIKLKSDRRYKPGNVKKVKGVWRGHPDTIELRQLEVPPGYMLRPPVVASSELVDALTKAGEL